MANVYVAIRDGGKTNEEGATRLLNKLAGSQNKGIVTTGDLALSPNGTPNSTVFIGTGDIVIPYLTYFFHGFVTAQQSVTIPAADATFGKRHRIVAYIDLAVVSSTNSNNPDAMKFKVVSGTASGSPTYPDDTAVQSSVGSGNPWVELGRVVQAANDNAIASGDISQTQPLFQLGGGQGGIQFAIIGTPAVLNDVTPNWIATKNGTFTAINGRIKTAPTGQALNGRINKNGVQVATFTVAAGANIVTPQTGLNIAYVSGDYFSMDITQVGSTVAGSDLTTAIS